MKLMKIEAATVEEASKEYCRRRDESGEGASTFPFGLWNGHRISYNGRVWQKGVDDPKAIYNPGGETPEFWKSSTL